MSTHFRPRPPTAPSSPVRPSTAHSTIREVPPSPPDSTNGDSKAAFNFDFVEQGLSHELPREDALPLERTASFASHKSETRRPDSRHSADVDSDKPTQALERDGIASGRSSPLKARSRSPKKRPTGVPAEATAQDALSNKKIANDAADTDPEANDDFTKWPSTPTPISREQKRTAYFPLTTAPRTATSPTSPPQMHNSRTNSPEAPSPSRHRALRSRPIPLKALNYSTPTKRISVSGQSHATGVSVASRHSVFSTPGRDEMERKKPLVEVDEGPFARVTSMGDLDMERRRISGGGSASERKKDGRRGKVCGLGCSMM